MLPPWVRDVLQSIQEQLDDNQDPVTVDLLPCAPDVVKRLKDGAHQLARSEYCVDGLDHLVTLAYERLRSATPNRCWRRLYTDACILRSLADLEWVTQVEFNAMASIARLDHAIVVAGPTGEGRLDLILNLIAKIQSEYLPSSPFLPSDSIAPPVPLKSAASLGLQIAQKPVSRLDSAPSLAMFQRTYSQKPFVLPGYILDWPALTSHPWRCPEYLRAVSGRGRVVPVEIGSDYRNDDWSQKFMLWDDFLDHIDFPNSRPQSRGTESENRTIFYLAQHNLLTQFPALRSDILVPDYVYSLPLHPAEFLQYRRPRNDEELVINAWLGPKDTVSPAHTDPFFNLYAQVVGRKTVWLAPPTITHSMYPYPSPSESMDPSIDQPHNPAANNIDPSMSNTSQVDVFAVTDTVQSSSKDKCPLFRENVVPVAMEATLEPGDLLFFPPGWWHAMRSEETSFSVSMWF